MTPTILAISFALKTAACLPVTGDVIRAGDMAKAVPAFASVPADTRLGYAPVPGATRIFRSSELRRVARRVGLILTETPQVCFQWHLDAPDAGRFLQAMQTALNLPDTRIEILETSRYAVPPGPIVFQVSSLSPPPAADPIRPVMWRGHVQYGRQRRFSVWARVRIVSRSTRVVANTSVAAGERISLDQVRLETYEGFPFDSRFPSGLDKVIGLVARRSLKPGAPVLAAQLERPLAVKKADMVKVTVQNGPAVVVAEGRAEAGGRYGDTIPIRNPKSGARYRAEITGPGQVVIRLPGK